jgi:3-deoxy-D-manno-octulosonic-acid transferase
MRLNRIFWGYKIYTVIWWCLSPILWLGMAWRARRNKQDWQILSAQRFGRYNQPWDGQKPIWLHAVSVGEVRAAAPLMRALIDQGERLLLTHMTPTGRDEARRMWQSEVKDGLILQRWVPYDFLSSMQGLIQHYQPRLTILIEREVWPNLIRASRLAGIPVVLASARFSEKSLKQAQVLDRFSAGLMRQTYATIDLVMAQTQDDAKRLTSMGAAHVKVTGNLKFDVQLPALALQEGFDWREKFKRPLIVIASTREGEDAQFVAAIQSHHNAHKLTPLYVLIPRHPQRFETAAQHIQGANLRLGRWSELKEPVQTNASAAWLALDSIDVLLGDTMGEMPFFYAASCVAIVCGSFEPHGGQNFIEACVAGAPTIVGPHTENFAQAVDSALAAGAIVQVNTPSEAIGFANNWVNDLTGRQGYRDAAQKWLHEHIGATQAMMTAMVDLETQRALQLTEPH